MAALGTVRAITWHEQYELTGPTKFTVWSRHRDLECNCFASRVGDCESAYQNKSNAARETPWLAKGQTQSAPLGKRECVSDRERHGIGNCDAINEQSQNKNNSPGHVRGCFVFDGNYLRSTRAAAAIIVEHAREYEDRSAKGRIRRGEQFPCRLRRHFHLRVIIIRDHERSESDRDAGLTRRRRLVLESANSRQADCKPI